MTETKAVPVIWRKDDHIPAVHAGWLIRETTATVRIARNPLSTGSLFYKPVYLRQMPTIKEAVTEAARLTFEFQKALGASLKAMLDSRDATRLAEAAYTLNLKSQVTATGQMALLPKAERPAE